MPGHPAVTTITRRKKMEFEEDVKMAIDLLTEITKSHDDDIGALEHYIEVQDLAIAKQRDEIVDLYDQVEKLWKMVHGLRDALHQGGRI